MNTVFRGFLVFLCFCSVILGLSMPQLVIDTVSIRKKRIVAAPLHDLAVIKYGDCIAEPAGGKAGRNPYFAASSFSSCSLRSSSIRDKILRQDAERSKFRQFCAMEERSSGFVSSRRI